jgi:hypothetical protein
VAKMLTAIWVACAASLDALLSQATRARQINAQARSVWNRLERMSSSSRCRRLYGLERREVPRSHGPGIRASTSARANRRTQIADKLGAAVWAGTQ